MSEPSCIECQRKIQIKDSSSQQDIRKCIEEKKELYEKLMKFLENSDNFEIHFQNLIEHINSKQIETNGENFKQFLELLTNIANNHHREGNLFQKIFFIIENLTNKIKQIFSNLELFKIFKSNKKILLFLFENKIITIDDTINKELIGTIETNGNQIKDFNKKEDIEEIEKQLLSIDPNIFDHFEQKRHEGENDTYICSLIRQDSEDFISHVTRTNVPLTSMIQPSIFEINQFLIDNKETTLIEYSSFFGSIQIFQYLRLNTVGINPSMFIHSIHSRNPELIHLLESIDKESIDYEKGFLESIKCHHNEIGVYIETNFLPENKEKRRDDIFLSTIMNFHNYPYFTSEIGESEFSYLCYYKYENLVELYMKENEKNIKEKTKERKPLIEFVNENQIDVVYYLLGKEEKIKGNEFKNNNKMKKIVIPPSISIIEDEFFYFCQSLTQIVIPSSVIKIGNYSFNECYSLKKKLQFLLQ
ncbi:hypothetical protein M9Y10_045573 [Tritrichomonas musculus]|uniref:Uncharacterized protein n=1 Tax=Tritrichomonas musculus TaxID=1915356 RepID=A0ABR2JW12_9EUKA